MQRFSSKSYSAHIKIWRVSAAIWVTEIWICLHRHEMHNLLVPFLFIFQFGKSGATTRLKNKEIKTVWGSVSTKNPFSWRHPQWYWETLMLPFCSEWLRCIHLTRSTTQWISTHMLIPLWPQHLLLFSQSFSIPCSLVPFAPFRKWAWVSWGHVRKGGQKKGDGPSK